MTSNLKGSLEGAGIGLLGGLVIGISDADWLRLVVVLALIIYTGNCLIETKSDSAGHSNRITVTGIAAFLAVVIGLYINGRQLFRETPKEAVSEWISAGYSPSQARVLYLKQIEEMGDNTVTESPFIQTLIQNLLKPTRIDSLAPEKVSVSDK